VALLVQSIVRPIDTEFNFFADYALISATLVLPTSQPDLKLGQNPHSRLKCDS
jgi:hypothetical protein